MNDLPIIQKTHDLIQWYVPILNQLPRDHKFMLAYMAAPSPPRRGARRAGWVIWLRKKLTLCQQLCRPTPAPPRRGF